MKNIGKQVHFIGIGGIGMSALARYFLSEGWKVSGSDLSPSDILKELRKEGAHIKIGHHYSLIRANEPINLVIYNQAIPEDNPELIQAKKFNIVCQSYPQTIGELTKKYKTIAIAGAHGKSTTTAMTALILIEAGYDPTVIVGTKLKEFGGSNFRKGKSEWLVLEADEFKAAFLNYFPTLAIVTNIDKEHLDFYRNFSNVKKAFEKFKKQCGGVLEAEKNPKILSEIKRVLKIPGKHNVYDASCAYSIAKHLGIPHKTIIKALGKYTGAWRRMEYKGEFKSQNAKVKSFVYDDYAHHPTEIKATLAGFREKWPKNAIICVFQPHQAERLKLLFNDFKTAFKDANKVVILPAYKVAGREEKFEKKYDAKALARSIDALYIKNPKKDLKKSLLSLITNNQLTNNSVIVMMGAGDIVNLTPRLIKKPE
jgi:UDP-N-acetylmuramate--alanine ligase